MSRDISPQPLTFDLTLSEVPIILLDPKTQEPRRYVLRELTGDTRDKYIEGMQKNINVEIDGDGVRKSRVKKFSGLQANLVILSLFCVMPDGTTIAITFEDVQTFPSRVLDRLFKESQKLSALGAAVKDKDKDKDDDDDDDDGEENAAKND